MKDTGITHADIAALAKVNELAARYGFRPGEFTTGYAKDDAPANRVRLSYELVPERDYHRFEAMVHSVCGEGEHSIEGPSEALLDRLDDALRQAPALMQERHAPKAHRPPAAGK
jgi:hypothetical protein